MDDVKGKAPFDDAVQSRVKAIADELRSKATVEDDGVDFPLAKRGTDAQPFGMLMASQIERRSFLKGASAVAAMGVVGVSASALQSVPAEAQAADSLTFTPIEGSDADEIIVPEGYEWNSIIQWGQSLVSTTPNLTDAQIRDGFLATATAADNMNNQFGYNCDAAEFFPLPGFDADGATSGIICVNHEYMNYNLLFEFGEEPDPANTRDRRNYDSRVEYFRANPEAARFARANVGITVAEIERVDGAWQLVLDSQFNRRITLDTPINLSGPAAGSDFVQTQGSSRGITVLGTYNNCAGGNTPWGTYLSAEENFDQIFGGFAALEERLGDSTDPVDIKTLDFHRRIVPRSGDSSLGLEATWNRFDSNRVPNEAFRYGWIVELDPYDPTPRPKKRTALGRFKHECATTIVATGGQVAVYLGDDARFEYLYKFVTAGTFNADNRAANMDLLDEGTLYVARFNDDGTGEWIAMDYDSQPALRSATVEGTDVPQFANQAEVLINVRRAADIMGATPMDRPEDVQANPVTGKVYMACTNNTRRTSETRLSDRQGREVDDIADIPNPRTNNSFGHIVEITEDGDDNAATTFAWEIFMLAGDPNSEEGRFLTQLNDIDEAPLGTNDTYFAGWTDASVLPAIGSPDNLGFDNQGNMWIVTDGRQPTGNNDGTFVVPTEGPTRGFLRQFMSSVNDSEVCGAEFTPDNETLFLNIQHPGDSGVIGAPASNFPNGGDSEPRPTLIGIWKTDGGVVGS